MHDIQSCRLAFATYINRRLLFTKNGPGTLQNILLHFTKFCILNIMLQPKGTFAVLYVLRSVLQRDNRASDLFQHHLRVHRVCRPHWMWHWAYQVYTVGPLNSGHLGDIEGLISSVPYSEVIILLLCKDRCPLFRVSIFRGFTGQVYTT